MNQLALAVSAFVLIGSLAGQTEQRGGESSSLKEAPRVYSSHPDDPWNQIFTALFTRTVETRLSDDIDGSEPHVPFGPRGFLMSLSVSKHTVTRTEYGDRAINPLYPSFMSARGVLDVLTDPRYAELKNALESALSEKSERTHVCRALMQSDLWAAFDILEQRSRFRDSNAAMLLERRSDLLALTAQLIRKLALTRDEIENLPNNFNARRKGPSLPPLFEKESDWIEIQWIPGRTHDFEADYRRAARVFMKPLYSPADRDLFLRNLQRARRPANELLAVALTTQLLLVTDKERVVPSPIINAVQLRTFVRGREGEITRGEIEQFELSRKLLLEDTATGGLVRFEEGAAAYLPSSGNDYDFASWHFGDAGQEPPILATLRSRCHACHFGDMTRIATLAVHARPPLPLIRYLDPLGNEHASYVAAKKQASDTFEALLRHWRLP